MRLSKSALTEVEGALRQYCDAVLASELSAASQAIYIDQATSFVRWLKDEYTPGARANPYLLKRKKDPAAHAFNPEASEQ
jgi:hypothetical protein